MSPGPAQMLLFKLNPSLFSPLTSRALQGSFSEFSALSWVSAALLGCESLLESLRWETIPLWTLLVIFLEQPHLGVAVGVTPFLVCQVQSVVVQNAYWPWKRARLVNVCCDSARTRELTVVCTGWPRTCSWRHYAAFDVMGV